MGTKMEKASVEDTAGPLIDLKIHNKDRNPSRYTKLVRGRDRVYFFIFITNLLLIILSQMGDSSHLIPYTAINLQLISERKL